MTDREALAAALGKVDRALDVTEHDDNLILAAARERLAQFPEKCEHGETEPHDFDNQWQGVSDCPGKLYPSALVERVRRSLLRVAGEVASDGSFWCPDIAVAVVAVFDALNGETE